MTIIALAHASVLTLTAAEAETAYVALREHLAAERTELASIQSRPWMPGIPAPGGIPNDEVRAESARRWSEYRRLDAVKYRLAVLTGRYDGRLPTSADMADVVARRAEMRAEVPA